MHAILHYVKPNFRVLLFILLAFLAGCFLTGFLIFGQRSYAIGKLDQRYDKQYAGAAETIGQLEGELKRERDINRQLREHNQRAGELAKRVTESADRNVRNLQDAVSLIGEIRGKLKILADFYNNSDSGYGGT